MSASQLRARFRKSSRSTSASSLPPSQQQSRSQNHSEALEEDNEQWPLLQRIRNPTKLLANEGDNITRWPKVIARTVWQVLSSSYMNVLLVFVPVGLVAGAMGLPPIAIFVLNFLAIMPLAALLSFATEELAAVLGPSIGGLCNATFGNAIELIVSIIALVKGEIRIVQASMLGSVLANILLVLGCCFIAGGIRRLESVYDPTLASVMAAMQTVAASALIVPAVLFASVQNSDDAELVDILVLSRGTSIILLLLYVLYLVFQLKTHASFFEDNGNQNEGGEEGPEGSTLSPAAAVLTLVLTTVCVGFCAEFLVDSIGPIVESTGVSKTFIGLILLPIISNAAEHVTAVVVAWKGKMNLALCVDIGSGLQIALFVTPVMVILGWILDIPMSLHFHGFETIIFFLSVLVVNYLIQGGRANYLEGTLCIGWYIIIALAFFFYPENTGGSGW